MRISGLNAVEGLGPGPDSSPTCGANPCGLTDYIWTSDACLSYLGCADPTNGLYVGATQGGLTVVSQAAGSAAGTITSDVVGGVVGGVVSGVSSSSGLSPVVIIGAAAAGLLLLMTMMKR
jgi:hypothetical protein